MRPILAFSQVPRVILLADTLRYFRSVAASSSNDYVPSASSRSEIPRPREQKSQRVVFYLDNLVAFKAAHLVQSTEPAEGVAVESGHRKRPNYNNQRRQFLASIKTRTAYLGYRLEGSTLNLNHTHPRPPGPRHNDNGTNPHRLQRLMTSTECRCQRRVCFKKIASIYESLCKFLNIFWGMAKHLQDSFVRD